MKKINFLFYVSWGLLLGDNQTDTFTPLLSPDSLPFQISIEQAPFTLPLGVYSTVNAIHHNKWLLLAGRTNGLHGFSGFNDNFPVASENTMVYVVDPISQIVYSRSLTDPESGLSQADIDSLAVTSPQFVQCEEILYMVGGYGFNHTSGQFGTSNILTALNVPGIIHWVMNPTPGKTFKQQMRQTSHPFLQVAGGQLRQLTPHNLFLLVFGQNFTGSDVFVDGIYSQQIRLFQIVDNGRDLFIQTKLPDAPNLNYRRTDYNLVPLIQKINGFYEQSYVALSGVFTKTGGVWTVPVMISPDGTSFMPNPSDPNTFKQAINNYNSAYIALYSEKTNQTYVILPGGISATVNEVSDQELPFDNSVSTIRIANGVFEQFLMDQQYPTILATFGQIGNPLLFGTSAVFFPTNAMPLYSNGVIALDKLPSSKVLLGYIVGGIASSIATTNTQEDSAASPYIFEISLTSHK